MTPLPESVLEQVDSLFELTLGAERSIASADGERRSFYDDGDTLILRVFANANGRTHWAE